MKTITTTSATTPQPLLSASLRTAAAVAAAALLAVVVIAARQASHEAVETVATTLSRSTAHVTLQTVEIVGRRPAGATTGRSGTAT